jgi:CRP-like cAMP-binding protein
LTLPNGTNFNVCSEGWISPRRPRIDGNVHLPHSEKLQPFLKKLARHTILTVDEQAALLGLSGSLEDVDAAKDFVRPGSEVNNACLVVEGLCARVGEMQGGTRQVTSFYQAGDMPDLHGVMVQCPTKALCAITQIRILKVPHRELRNLTQAFPAIFEAFWRDTVLDAAIAAEWVVNIGQRDAKTRIAHLYCEMALRSGRATQNSFEFSFPATQTNLADATGLSTVHTNRSLQTLRREGALQVKGATVFVPDWARLKELADFDEQYLHPQSAVRAYAVQ